MLPRHSILGFNGMYLIQHQEASMFHHHKISAASRSTERQQDLISRCGWMTFTEPAGSSLWTLN